MEENIYAAIAMALYEYQGNNVHDKESGIITINPRQTMWNAKFLSLTAKPSKKSLWPESTLGKIKVDTKGKAKVTIQPNGGIIIK